MFSLIMFDIMKNYLKYGLELRGCEEDVFKFKELNLLKL